MDYFVEGTMNANNTVIERAAIARLTTFAKLGREAKLVLMAYAPEWQQAVPAAMHSRVIGLFDHLQAAPHAGSGLTMKALDHVLGGYERTQISTAKGLIHYTAGDRLIAKVHQYPDRSVSTVTFVGANEQTLEVDKYDVRGFLSRRQFWYAGQRTHEEYLAPSGEVRVEITLDQGKIALIRLPASGRVYLSLAALQAAYCQTLGPAQALISDRREYDVLALAWPAAQHFLRLYNAAPAVAGEATLITRQPGRGGVAIDEYGGTAEAIQAGWQRLLK